MGTMDRIKNFIKECKRSKHSFLDAELIARCKIIKCSAIIGITGGLIYLFIVGACKETDVYIKSTRNISYVPQEEQIVNEDKEFLITRTAKGEAEISLHSLIIDNLLSVSTEAEAIAAFNDCVELCNNIKATDEVITIPKGAGKLPDGIIDSEKISLYFWKRGGKCCYGKKDFSKCHVVLFLYDNYVEVTYDCLKKISMSISTGTLR